MKRLKFLLILVSLILMTSCWEPKEKKTSLKITKPFYSYYWQSRIIDSSFRFRIDFSKNDGELEIVEYKGNDSLVCYYTKTSEWIVEKGLLINDIRSYMKIQVYPEERCEGIVSDKAKKFVLNFFDNFSEHFALDTIDNNRMAINAGYNKELLYKVK